MHPYQDTRIQGFRDTRSVGTIMSFLAATDCAQRIGQSKYPVKKLLWGLYKLFWMWWTGGTSGLCKLWNRCGRWIRF